MRTGENVEVRNITLPKSRSPWDTGVREGEGILTLERSVWMGSSLGMGPVSRRVETSTMRPRLELARSLSLSSGGGGGRFLCFNPPDQSPMYMQDNKCLGMISP